MDQKSQRVISKKNRILNQIPVVKDRCPRCKLKFSKRRIKILYKEFCECKECGHNFMAYDIDMVIRFT